MDYSFKPQLNRNFNYYTSLFGAPSSLTIINSISDKSLDIEKAEQTIMREFQQVCCIEFSAFMCLCKYLDHQRQRAEIELWRRKSQRWSIAILGIFVDFTFQCSGITLCTPMCLLLRCRARPSWVTATCDENFKVTQSLSQLELTTAAATLHSSVQPCVWGAAGDNERRLHCNNNKSVMPD